MSKITHLTLDESGGLARRRIHLREISGDADAPLETVGQDLRAARLRRGDDLATVSKALKIRKDHLEALEEDRIAALPGRTYAVGFIRTYAEYLGLDPVQFVERFKAEIAGREEAPPPPSFADETDERRLPQGWMVIAVVVLLLIFYGAYHLARSADSMLQKPVEAVPSRIAPKVAQTKPAPPPPVATALGPDVPAENAATAPSTSKNGAAPGLPSDNSDSLQSAPADKTGSAKSAQNEQVATGQTATDQQASTPKGFVYGQQNSDTRVVLQIIQPTKILVQGADGRVFMNRMLKAGDSYQVPDLVGLSLSTPNGAAIEIILDGQAMGRATRKPQVVEGASLDPQSIADRFSRGSSG